MSTTALQPTCHLNVVAPGSAPADLVPALAGLAELGYGAVVLNPLDPDVVDAAEMRAIFADHGIVPITLAGQAPGANVASEDASDRVRGVAALRRQVELTVALGGDQMNGVPYGLFGPPGVPTSAAALERAAGNVGSVADYAADHGILMTFEVLNRYETSALNTSAQAVAFVEASGSSNLRIHLDTFHMVVEEGDSVAAVQHAVAAGALGYLELGNSGRGDLATGSADVLGVLDAAIAGGYRGRVGYEAFSRAVLSEGQSNGLAIWREPFADGLAVAGAALDYIRPSLAAASV